MLGSILKKNAAFNNLLNVDALPKDVGSLISKDNKARKYILVSFG